MALRALAGASFSGNLELPSGLVLSPEEAQAYAAALVEQSLIREPDTTGERTRCGSCNMGLRIGDQKLLVHQDGSPICGTPERTAWLSARHLLKVEPHDDRERRPIGVAVIVLVFGLLGALCWGGVWAVGRILGDVL